MEEFDQLWREFDESETDEPSFSKMSLLDKLLLLPLEGGKKEKIELEQKTVYLIFALRWILSRTEEVKIEKINSYLQLYFPIWTGTEISYFTSRLQETKSYQNKWRYAFLCFLLTRKPHYIRDTINHLLDCSKIHLELKELLPCVDLLVMAFNINRLYNLNLDNEINKISLEIIFRLEDTEYERYLIEPIEVFSLLNNKTEKDVIARLFTIAHRAAKRFLDEKNYHLQRSLLNASLGLCNLTDISKDEKLKLKKQIQLIIAASHEAEADNAFKENNGLVAVKWYEDAQKIYQQVGMPKKVKELGEKIRESSKMIQWKTISTTIRLPQLDFEGKNSTELVRLISQFKAIIPDQLRIEQLARESMKDNPLLSILPATHYGRKNPIGHTSDNESKLRSEIKLQTLQHIKFAEHWFADAIQKLEEQKRISEVDFTNFISSFGLHDKDSLEFLRSGIKHHFNQDYVASIHILIPQVENTLRLLLNSHGISTIKVDGKEMTIMDSQMGGILDNDDVVKVLGNDFTSYLQIKFTDTEGINLRNEVAHGLLPLKEFSHITSISIIHTIMILTRISIERQ